MKSLKTAQAQALRKETIEARKALDQAHAEYLHVYEIAMDVDVGADSGFGLVEKGRAYASAVTRYTEATMAWLVFTEAQLRDNKAKGKGS